MPRQFCPLVEEGGRMGYDPTQKQILTVLRLLENSFDVLFQSGLFWWVGWRENSLLLFKSLCSSGYMCLSSMED